MFNGRHIVRHPLNQRKMGGVTRQYTRKIMQCGIIPAVRGEAWFVWDETKRQYLALTFGTSNLGVNLAWLVSGSSVLHLPHLPCIPKHLPCKTQFQSTCRRMKIACRPEPN